MRERIRVYFHSSFSLFPFFFAGCVLSTFSVGIGRVWRHLRFEQVPRALLEMHHRRNEINIPNLILNSYCVWCVLVSPAEFLFFSSQANCSARLSPPVKLWATLARNTLFSRALPFSLVCSSLHHLLLPTLGTHIGSVPDRIGEWVMRRIVYSVSPRQSLSPPPPAPAAVVRVPIRLSLDAPVSLSIIWLENGWEEIYNLGRNGIGAAGGS